MTFDFFPNFTPIAADLTVFSKKLKKMDFFHFPIFYSAPLGECKNVKQSRLTPLVWILGDISKTEFLGFMTQ